MKQYNKDIHPIDDLMRNELQDYSMPVSDQLWLRIEAQLPNEPKRRVVAFWQKPMFIAAAASVALLITIGTFILNNRSNIGNTEMAQNNQANKPAPNTLETKEIDKLTPKQNNTKLNNSSTETENFNSTAITKQSVNSNVKNIGETLSSNTIANNTKEGINTNGLSKNETKNKLKQTNLAEIESYKNSMLSSQDLKNTATATLHQKENVPNANVETEIEDTDTQNKENKKTRHREATQALPLALPTTSTYDIEEVHTLNDPMFNAKEVRDAREKTLGLKGWYAGVEATYNNTWILTQSNKAITEPSTNSVTNTLTFSPSYGVRLGYDMNSKFGFETKALQFEVAQNFMENSNGKENLRRIALQYYSVPLMFKFKWSRLSGLTSYPTVMNYKVGLQYSHLRNAYANINNALIPLNDTFRKHEFGLVMGIDYDFYFNKHLFASLGFAGYYGAHTRGIASYINANTEQKTNNLSAGLNASINYKFNKKK